VFQRFFPLAAAQLESSCIPHYPPYERGRTSGTQGRKRHVWLGMRKHGKDVGRRRQRKRLDGRGPTSSGSCGRNLRTAFERSGRGKRMIERIFRRS
jgi:hypothetical protein